ncbi:MAG: hypothetical protein ACJASN_002614, partial [Cyclobacteriaceae bacterium]
MIFNLDIVKINRHLSRWFQSLFAMKSYSKQLLLVFFLSVSSLGLLAQVENSLEFSRASLKHVSVPHSSVQNVGAGDFTLEAWIYPTAGLDATAYTILSKDENNKSEYIFSMYDGGDGAGTAIRRIALSLTSDGS